MNLPGLSVRRPVMTSMVTSIIVVLGAVSLSRIQIDLLPDVELPTVSVRTEWEGASPEVMEQRVTQIIEEIVATVPGVEEMTSTSQEGRSDVRVSFVWGTDIDTAALDLQGRIEDELSELPEEISRPQVRKFDISSFPVVLIGVLGDLDPVELTTLIEDQLRYRFGRVPGVAQVDLWGGFRREVRIALDPSKVNALQIPLDDVLEAVRSANLDLPAGEIEQGRFEVTLRAPAQFTDLDEIRNTVVALREGAPVTIGQIGRVLDTYEKPTEIERINGERGIRVAIRKQASANTVEVARAILEEIEAANAAFPRIRVVPVINQGNFIELSIANVARSVLYGGGLAIVVLLLFLRSLRSTLVIGLAIPISLVATFALIYFGGFTVNLMTLGGLALGVGMMVDNSIVVLENIFRRRDEEQEGRTAAAVEGAREVGPAIVASTITTLVVFLPMVFMRGVSGLLFQELAFVIVFALVCSLGVSLSLVPVLASRLVESPEALASGRASRPRWIARLADRAERWQVAVDAAYHSVLNAALHHRPTTLTVAIGLLASSLLLVPAIGTEFMPPSDEGEVHVTGEMEVGTRLDLVDRQTQEIEAVVRRVVPELRALIAQSEGHLADVRISLPPAGERDRSNVEIAAALREQLEDGIAGMDVRVRAPAGQFLLQRILGSDQGLTIEVRGFSLETLDLLSRRAVAALEDVPGVLDVDTTKTSGIPQQEVTVDRAKAADLGLSVRDVAEALETAIAGSQAGEYRSEGNSYRILVQLAQAEKLSIEDVLDLTLSTPAGERVALRNVVATVEGRGPIQIDRKDQQRIAIITANVVGRDLGSVAADVQAALSSIARPAGYELVVAGTFEEQQEAFGELGISMLLALVLVYMVMAAQYESLRDPLVVMCSVPLAAIGVLLMLFLTGTTLNVQSYIGCILLGGIVVNNAILLVDQAGRLRVDGGLDTRAAVSEAGRRRLRPILMTTLTTILGLLPLALGIGEGADAQAPMARAVVGGLFASTLVTLVLIPVVYTFAHPDGRPLEADDEADREIRAPALR